MLVLINFNLIDVLKFFHKVALTVPTANTLAGTTASAASGTARTRGSASSPTTTSSAVAYLANASLVPRFKCFKTFYSSSQVMKSNEPECLNLASLFRLLLRIRVRQKGRRWCHDIQHNDIQREVTLDTSKKAALCIP